MTYKWIDFNLIDALSGAVIGLRQSKSYDLSMTGKLAKVSNGASPYMVMIQGVTFYIDEDGTVVSSTPSLEYIGRKMQIVTAEMGTNAAVGSNVTRSEGSSGSGRSDVASLTTTEPRDHFAMNVLNAMLIHSENPETFDDATCLMYSRSAYRWAQAMMIAAADSREGKSTTPTTDADVNAGDLQSNTEKVLYNLNQSVKELTKQLETSAQDITTKIGTSEVDLKNQLAASLTGIDNTLSDIDTTIEKSYKVEKVSGNISITASIYDKNKIRLEFASRMAYSDISIIFELNVKEGTADSTKKVGYIMPRGSVVTVVSLEESVTELTKISSATIRGTKYYDTNTYVISIL